LCSTPGWRPSNPVAAATAADVVVGSSAVFMRQFDMLPDSEAIGDYADRCLERPAYQRALAAEEK